MLGVVLASWPAEAVDRLQLGSQCDSMVGISLALEFLDRVDDGQLVVLDLIPFDPLHSSSDVF